MNRSGLQVWLEKWGLWVGDHILWRQDIWTGVVFNNPIKSPYQKHSIWGHNKIKQGYWIKPQNGRSCCVTGKDTLYWHLETNGWKVKWNPILFSCPSLQNGVVSKIGTVFFPTYSCFFLFYAIMIRSQIIQTSF